MNEDGYYTLAERIVNSLPQSAVREALINIFAAVLQSNARMVDISAQHCLASNSLRTTGQYCQQSTMIDESEAWKSVRDAAKWQRYMRGEDIPENEVYYTCRECLHFTRHAEEATSGTCPHCMGLFSCNATVETCTHFKRKEHQ